MRVDTLPSPGRFSNAIVMRNEAAKAISYTEILAGRSLDRHSGEAGAQLLAFFRACAKAVEATLPQVIDAEVADVTAQPSKSKAKK